jgi:hypothetical protein
MISIHVNPISRAHLIEMNSDTSTRLAGRVTKEIEAAHPARTAVNGYGDSAYWELSSVHYDGSNRPSSIKFTVEKNCQSIDVIFSDDHETNSPGALVLRAELAAKMLIDRGVFFEGKLATCGDTTQGINTPKPPVGSSGGKIVCDYIAPYELTSVLPTSHATKEQPAPTRVCLYAKGSTDDKSAGALSIMLTDAQGDQIDATYKQVLDAGAKQLSGIGQKAAIQETNSVVIVYVIKNGTVAALQLNVDSSQITQEVSVQAQKLAQFVAGRM